MLGFVLLGCGDDQMVDPVESANDSRTVESVTADGSCGCPSNHQLVCVSDGVEVPRSSACVVTQSPVSSDLLFVIDYAGGFGDCDGVGDQGFEPFEDPERWEALSRAAAYCTPIN